MAIQRPIGFSPWEISAMINEEVVTQHAEEAAFLWILRDNAVSAPHYSLKDLAGLDERVEAHIDGLCIAGQFGWKTCESALESNGPGEVFAAAVLAFESDDTERIRKVLEVGISSPKLERPLVSAMGWIPFDRIENIFKELLQSEHPEIRRVGIAAYAVNRKEPGLALSQAVSDQNSQLRARALRVAGELGRTDLLSTVMQSSSDPDAYCRFNAAWSSARLGMRSEQVIAGLKMFTEQTGPNAECAMGMVLRCMELPHAKEWLQTLGSNPDLLRFSVIGVGFLGDPELIDHLIACMEDEKIARVAGEAFSMITGVDLAYQDLDQDQPEGFESGPSEEPEDEDVALDKDEDLPWPAPALISKWWAENRKNFRFGRRYLMGKEISKDSLMDTLRHGKQRQRLAAALELGLMEPKRLMFETRAPGKRQMQEMGLWTS